MIIDLISDLHGNYPELEGGDLLIVAGDHTASDTSFQWSEFLTWLMYQPYRKKIYIGGNHDNLLVNSKPKIHYHTCADGKNRVELFEYLCDSGTEFTYWSDREDGSKYIKTLKIWGSPWSLWFNGINPHCKAFTGSESDLIKKFDLIPDDIDILITHSPPYGILDKVKKYNTHGCWDPKKDGYQNVGSKSLAAKVGKMETPPKLWVWGHIHECYGKDLPVRDKPCIMVNASHVNEDYDAVNKPIRIIL